MSNKELTIVFVYNTDLVKHEYDDPALAVVYFCPSWLSEEKKTTICGQIIGTAHFLKSVFGKTQIISLENGKFCIKEFGKYIMAVGIDRNVPNWILENKVEFLSNLIEMFHVSFEHMSTFYKDTQTFVEKLHQMFESCLNFMNLDTFAHKLPDLNQSSIFKAYSLQAEKFLNNLLETKYVLAGLVQWNNKLLATQLNSLLTKCLLLTNATKTKLSAESIMTDFQFPKDLQLLQIYVNNEYYEEILQESKSCRSSHSKSNNDKKEVYKETHNGFTIKLLDEWNSYGYYKSTQHLTDFERASNNVIILRNDNKKYNRCIAKSLCDPINPFISSKGIAISKNMYEEYFSFNNGYFKKLDINGKTGNKMKTFCKDNLFNKNDSTSKYYHNKTINAFGFEDLKIDLAVDCLTGNLQINDKENLQVLERSKQQSTKSVHRMFEGHSMLIYINNVYFFNLVVNQFNVVGEWNGLKMQQGKTQNNKIERSEFKDCVLFLLNFQDISINLFLEDGASDSSDIINQLYEQCTLFAEDLSEQFENLVDGTIYSENSSSSQETCSYLFTNHKWEHVHEGGLKDNIDLNTITEMHECFINDEEIADIVLRTDKNVIYGHQNENRIVYYQLGTNNCGGAPSSTGCMANIFGKARRRLSQTSRSSSLNLT